MHLAKYAGDSTLFDFDCTNLLAEDEVISGTPVMSALPDGFVDPDEASNLVFGVPVVNATPITYPDGRVMETGKGFQVRISAGTPSSPTAKRIYAVMGTFETSDENTLSTKAPLWLLPPGYADNNC